MFMQLQPIAGFRPARADARRSLRALLFGESNALVLVLGILILITLRGVGSTI